MRVLERGAVGLVEELPHVVERRPARVVLEGADEHVRGRQEQERRGEGEERQHAEPGERQAAPRPAGLRRPGGDVGARDGAQEATSRPSWASRSRSSSFAFVLCDGLANFTFEYMAALGSAAVSAFGTTFRPTMSVKSAGCAYPFR